MIKIDFDLENDHCSGEMSGETETIIDEAASAVLVICNQIADAHDNLSVKKKIKLAELIKAEIVKELIDAETRYKEWKKTFGEPKRQNDNLLPDPAENRA